MTLIEQAQKYLNNNNFSQAIASCNEELQKNPLCLKAYWYMAQAYQKMGQLEDANSNYKLLLEENYSDNMKYFFPNHTASFSNKSILKPDFEELFNAEFSENDQSIIYADYALLLEQNKSYEEALKYYRKSCDKNKKQAQSIIGQFRCYLEMHNQKRLLNLDDVLEKIENDYQRLCDLQVPKKSLLEAYNIYSELQLRALKSHIYSGNTVENEEYLNESLDMLENYYKGIDNDNNHINDAKIKLYAISGLRGILILSKLTELALLKESSFTLQNITEVCLSKIDFQKSQIAIGLLKQAIECFEHAQKNFHPGVEDINLTKLMVARYIFMRLSWNNLSVQDRINKNKLDEVFLQLAEIEKLITSDIQTDLSFKADCYAYLIARQIIINKGNVFQFCLQYYKADLQLQSFKPSFYKLFDDTFITKYENTLKNKLPKVAMGFIKEGVSLLSSKPDMASKLFEGAAKLYNKCSDSQGQANALFLGYLCNLSISFDNEVVYPEILVRYDISELIKYVKDKFNEQISNYFSQQLAVRNPTILNKLHIYLKEYCYDELAKSSRFKNEYSLLYELVLIKISLKKHNDAKKIILYFFKDLSEQSSSAMKFYFHLLDGRVMSALNFTAQSIKHAFDQAISRQRTFLADDNNRDLFINICYAWYVVYQDVIRKYLAGEEYTHAWDLFGVTYEGVLRGFQLNKDSSSLRYLLHLAYEYAHFGFTNDKNDIVKHLSSALVCAIAFETVDKYQGDLDTLEIKSLRNITDLCRQFALNIREKSLILSLPKEIENSFKQISSYCTQYNIQKHSIDLLEGYLRYMLTACEAIPTLLKDDAFFSQLNIFNTDFSKRNNTNKNDPNFSVRNALFQAISNKMQNVANSLQTSVNSPIVIDTPHTPERTVNTGIYNLNKDGNKRQRTNHSPAFHKESVLVKEHKVILDMIPSPAHRSSFQTAYTFNSTNQYDHANKVLKDLKPNIAVKELYGFYTVKGDILCNYPKISDDKVKLERAIKNYKKAVKNAQKINNENNKQQILTLLKSRIECLDSKLENREYNQEQTITIQ